MSIVYLNGDFLPMQEARISPMDRGFLFGDGIYEVIPAYGGRMVGFAPHLARMRSGLQALEIHCPLDETGWRGVCEQLIEHNGGGDLGIYLHVSRGADSGRNHAYPTNIAPTLYAFAYAIPPELPVEKSTAKAFTVSTAEDLRWRRCNIKSTALLGNVMHLQQGHAAGHAETILYNTEGELTEAAACNVYVIKNGSVATPPLDHQILPGITRHILLEILRKDGGIPVEERNISVTELRDADEVWLSSSSKGVAPVLAVDGEAVGNGEIGDVWLAAQTLYAAHKFDY